MNITKKSLDRPVTTLMIFICFIIIGIIASRLIPLEYFPDIDLPFVEIEIPYPGSTPEEIEQQITRPVEEVLATISGVKRMISDSSENQCNIHLRFDWGIDTDVKAVEVREIIDSMRNQLPTDVEHIYLRQFSSTDMEMLQLRLSSNRDLSEYYDMLNRVLKRPLEGIDGVSRVNMYGVEKKEIRIQLLADRIIAHRVDLARLAEVLRRSNFLVTAGRITDTNRRFRVQPIGEFQSLKEIEELIIGENNLKLKDIAIIAYKQPRLTYGRHLDRKYAVGLDIFKEAGANTVETANRAKEELKRISKDPRMEGISIYFMEDQSEGIISSINELLKAGIIGAGLAIFLLFFFLRRLSTTFIVALAVPFSLLVTLAFMYFFNMSLNILSMMGLMLAVGDLTFERRRSMGGEDSLKIYLRGKSSTQLVDLSREVAVMLAKVPGLINARSDAEAGEQEIQVVVDRDRAAQYGFATNQVANMVAVAMRGVNLRRFRDEFGEIDVKVEFQEGDKQTLEQLQNLVLYDRQKQPIKLSTLANFQVRRGPRGIHREDRVTSLGVSINLKDITVSQAKKKIQRFMDRYHLPAGCSWSFGSSFDHDAETFNTMMVNLLLAICLIYFIMASLFESMIFPAAIVSSIIFAIIGVFWFFMFTNTTFSLMALIGILILIGVVVNNGIVLIDHINRFRDRGFNRHEAIVKAGMERIRPILMTAGTTILSLVPLCIVNTQIGGDGPPYYPMARAIVGGLAFSTIVTLLVLPRIYVLLDDWRLWAGKLIGRANELSKKPILRKLPGKG
jgi:multidrug efflux pump subunit AcrB